MEYYGKKKCRILRQIRSQIAEQNDIAWVTEECKHKGNCKGTCPKCEEEIRQLEKELEKRRSLGKNIAIAGVAAGIAATMSSCLQNIGNQSESNGPWVGAVLINESQTVETFTEDTDVDTYVMMGDIPESETSTDCPVTCDQIADMASDTVKNEETDSQAQKADTEPSATDTVELPSVFSVKE